MNLNELEALAKAALKETAPYVRAIAIDEYRQATYPETILSMIALLREMGEALEAWTTLDLDEQQCDVVLRKYKEMTK